MKKKTAAFVSGIILLTGIGMYILGNPSLLYAKEEQKTALSAAEPVSFNGPSLFAMNNVLTNSKFKQAGADSTLPEGYYFFAKPNKNTRYFKINRNTKVKTEFQKQPPTWTGIKQSFLDLDGTNAAYFSNVGEYKGKTVDMMVSIEAGFTAQICYEELSDSAQNSFASIRFLTNKSSKTTKVTYSYFDNATGQPLVVKGVFNNFFDTGLSGRMTYDTTIGDGMFISDKSLLKFDTDGETQTKTVISGVEGYNAAGASPNNYVTNVFTGSYFTVEPTIYKNTNPYYVSMACFYNQNTVARMKTPTPEIKGSLEENGSKHNTSFTITMNQSIPFRLSNFKKYSNFSYTLPTYNLYKVASIKAIATTTGKDESSNFSLSGDKITINPNFLSQDSFYGETYEIQLTYNLDTTKDYFSLYQNGYLVMPFKPITQTSDLDGTQLSNETTAKIKWDYQLEITANDLEYSQGDVKRFNTDSEAFKQRLLTDSQAKGKNLNLKTEIPVAIKNIAIDSKVGTYPVTLTTQDGDITLTKKINVTVKAIPPKVSIPENGTTVISSKGVPYTFSGTVSDEDSEDLSLFVTVDDGAPTTIWDKQVNTELNQPIDFTYEIPGTQLTELGDHTVKIYAKDGEGNPSEIAQFTLDIRGYLAFKELPPATMDFDPAKINSKGSYAKLNKSVDFSIEDYRGSNTSWKLVGSLVSALRDDTTNTTITDGIIYRDAEGNETPFTKEATINLSKGKATSNNVLFPIKWGVDDKGIFIKTPPEVKKGNYKGSIEMSLVDAP